ncbi:isocitrate lyase/phosphoenolpyruvate mutase family protein, partial [Pseudomonas sp. K5002]|nr:isocitrate lyase/phosphoenolpyruvate mutase family protein [Pseudomonas sp. K5002]
MTAHATAFHALHHAQLLILPNVADAGGARLV